jgi:FMN phosphatase YigB (HAD superfamily)
LFLRDCNLVANNIFEPVPKKNRFFCGIMTIIFDFNRTLFDPEMGNIFLGVGTMLQRLSRKHVLILITRKEGSRESVIRDLKLEKLFKQIILLEQKSVEAFNEAAGNAEEVMVVGDRLIDEIAIGNTLGFVTVHVKQGIFAEQGTDIIPTHSINKIGELEDIVTRYEK